MMKSLRKQVFLGVLLSLLFTAAFLVAPAISEAGTQPNKCCHVCCFSISGFCWIGGCVQCGYPVGRPCPGTAQQ